MTKNVENFLPATGMLMTCPSADRLCSIPDSDGPRWPMESSSSELPPSRPGLKLGRLLSPTCANIQVNTHMNTKSKGLNNWILVFKLAKKKLTIQLNFSDQLPGGAGQEVHSA